MNSREILNREIDIKSRAPGYEENAIALRELDQLLVDMRLALEIHARDAMSRHPSDVAEILDRAAQVGYGEK